MGVTIGIVIGVVMVIPSLLFRGDLGVLRNLVLMGGTPLAILLAVWGTCPVPNIPSRMEAYLA